MASSGPYSLALSGLQSLLANMAAWQTFTGTNNPSDAAARVQLGDIGVSIASITIASNIVTVHTREAHGFAAGQSIELEGASIGAQSDNPLAGVKTVATVPSSVSLTFSQTSANDSFAPADALIMPARPYAVAIDASGALKAKSIGSGGTALFSGMIELLIEADVSSNYVNDSVGAMLEARNAIGLIVQGIIELSDSDYLLVSQAEVAAMPQFISKPEQNSNAVRFERWQALIQVSWGLES